MFTAVILRTITQVFVAARCCPRQLLAIYDDLRLRHAARYPDPQRSPTNYTKIIGLGYKHANDRYLSIIHAATEGHLALRTPGAGAAVSGAVRHRPHCRTARCLPNRRMGKIRIPGARPAVPQAQRAGYLTLYLNLWQAQATPAQALVAAISQSVEPKGLARILKRLKGLKSLKASAALQRSGGGVSSRRNGRASNRRWRRRYWWICCKNCRPTNGCCWCSMRRRCWRASSTPIWRTRYARIWTVASSRSRSCSQAAPRPHCVRCLVASTNPSTTGPRSSRFPLLGEEFVHALTALVNGLSRLSIEAARRDAGVRPRCSAHRSSFGAS